MDPLIKSYPELTSYQFASNSPIANVDLDGGESKYYTLELEKIFNGQGKLIKTVTLLIEDKSNEAGWTMHKVGFLPTYKFNGDLGGGSLYNVVEKTTNLRSDGTTRETIWNSQGSFYIPAPEDSKQIKNPFRINLKIFGKGYDPDNAASFKPSNEETVSFNLENFDDSFGGLSTGEGLGKPGKKPTLGGLDVLKSFAGAAQDLNSKKEIKGLKKNLEAAINKALQSTGPSVHCKNCGKNYVAHGNLLSNIETDKKAVDTTNSHGDPVKKK